MWMLMLPISIARLLLFWMLFYLGLALFMLGVTFLTVADVLDTDKNRSTIDEYLKHWEDAGVLEKKE